MLDRNKRSELLYGSGVLNDEARVVIRVVNLRKVNLSIPKGILKEGLLRRLIKIADLSEDEFLDNL